MRGTVYFIVYMRVLRRRPLWAAPGAAPWAASWVASPSVAAGAAAEAAAGAAATGSGLSSLRTAASRQPHAVGAGRRAPACAVWSTASSILPWSSSSTDASVGRACRAHAHAHVHAHVTKHALTSGSSAQHCVASCSSSLGQHASVTPSSGDALPWYTRVQQASR
eukprot:scaffold61345_cov52-Phaeocystis_antarctica.AAC.2